MSDSDMIELTIEEQIRSVKREVALRITVYPKRVAAGKMKQEQADREIATMRAVLATLEWARDVVNH